MLHEYIESLTEEDAAATAAFLLPQPNRKLSRAEIALIELGLAQADAGELIPIEELEAEFDIE
jgi:predicted transcriptional regulator